eukprot:jgi/Mesvir1/24600/Mv25999-RA.1
MAGVRQGQTRAAPPTSCQRDRQSQRQRASMAGGRPTGRGKRWHKGRSVQGGQPTAWC